MNHLDKLTEAYANAPEIFHVGRYWRAYEARILEQVKTADLAELRSGKYPIFNTFGFNDLVHQYHPNMPLYVKLIRQGVRKLFIDGRAALPYSMRLEDIQEMAYRHCELQGELSVARPISTIQASSYGHPQDLFRIDGRGYTMNFLSFYLRYCFAQTAVQFTGNEIVVELGSGAGTQVEILKKLYPNLTILCFDLPAQLYLCENYLTNALGSDIVVSSEHNLTVTDITDLEKGKVHMFGNWQFPLLKNFRFDIFWNAASFGEMEPEIVANYLSYIKGSCEWIYLLQARQGKESSASSGVVKPIKFADYEELVGKDYGLIREADAYDANRRLSKTGGYFQALWKRK